MQVELLEAVFEEAQRSLFSGVFAQRKSGEFQVEGQWFYFQRRSAVEVVLFVGDERFDCPLID